MTTKLKPCRECNGKGIIKKLYKTTSIYFIKCVNCGKQSGLWQTEELAIKAWNERTEK